MIDDTRTRDYNYDYSDSLVETQLSLILTQFYLFIYNYFEDTINLINNA